MPNVYVFCTLYIALDANFCALPPGSCVKDNIGAHEYSSHSLLLTVTVPVFISESIHIHGALNDIACISTHLVCLL